MDIRKQPGCVSRHTAAQEDMALINQLAKTVLDPEQVYTFAVRLCDNEIDRDFERFDRNSLEKLCRLFVGKSGIFDHNWSANGQTARLYKTELCQESGITDAGESRWYLKGFAYMLRSEKNSDLIEEIEAGIKKEVSIGCSVGRSVCSICGQSNCGHQGGRRYDGKLCYFTLEDPVDAYEWSFVAVPAQRKAGVIKAFAAEGGQGLRKLLKDYPGYLEYLTALELDAEMGRSYMKGLRKDLVRLMGLVDDTLDLKTFSGIVDKLDERELLAMTKAYQSRAEAKYPLSTQLHPQEHNNTSAMENGAFLI